MGHILKPSYASISLIRDLKKGILILLLMFQPALILTGCGPKGSAAIHSTHVAYNLAIQKTSDEQMLLNLIRLRYRDTPTFLEISSISAQFSFTSSAQAGGNINEKAPDVLNLGASISFSERPTVTYIPFRGEKFTQRFLAPISIETIMLLYHSGWSADRIFRLCVQRMNYVENATSASGPTPKIAPNYKEFLQVSSLLRTLQIKGAINIVYYRWKDSSTKPCLYIEKNALNWPETKRLQRLLGLDKERNVYLLTTDIGNRLPDAIYIEPRSLMGVLFYLSQGIQVPESDLVTGKVTTTLDRAGRPFSWQKLLKGLFQVQCSRFYPSDSAVAVKYRGWWFYIADTDLETKSTFALLSQIFALQAGKVKGVHPLLTLPVGG